VGHLVTAEVMIAATPKKAAPAVPAGGGVGGMDS
jgi:hypothetical protein